jgi:hypothetical protein
MMAKTFIFDGVAEKLDQNYGLPHQKILDDFQKTIKKIKEIGNYQVLMQSISFDKEITTSEKMLDFLKDSVEVSNYQKYTKLN